MCAEVKRVSSNKNTLYVVDIDECMSSPCMNNGTCTEASNGYTCKSAPGYTGVNCETSMSDSTLNYNAMKDKTVKHYKENDPNRVVT